MRIHRQYLSLLLVLIGFCSIGQQLLTDKRDSNQYEIVQLGDLYWMTENLRFEARGSILSDKEEGYRFYSFENLENVCPNGWRIPNLSEWELFIDSFEGVDLARMMEGNKKLFRVDFLDGYNIFEDNVLSIKPTGRMQGGEWKEGDFTDVWTKNDLSPDVRFHMHFDPNSVMGHGHKHHLVKKKPDEFRKFTVRCVCEKLDE